MREVTDSTILDQLNGPKEVTDAAILAQLNGPQRRSPLPFGLDRMGEVPAALGETAAYLGGQAAKVGLRPLFAAQGISQGLEAITGNETLGIPSRTIEKAFTYHPKTETAKNVAGAIEAPFKWLNQVGEPVADWVREKTQPILGEVVAPFVATTVGAVPPAIASLWLGKRFLKPKFNPMKYKAPHAIESMEPEIVEEGNFPVPIRRAEPVVEGQIATPLQLPWKGKTTLPEEAPPVLPTNGGPFRLREVSPVKPSPLALPMGIPEIGNVSEPLIFPPDIAPHAEFAAKKAGVLPTELQYVGLQKFAPLSEDAMHLFNITKPGHSLEGSTVAGQTFSLPIGMGSSPEPSRSLSSEQAKQPKPKPILKSKAKPTKSVAQWVREQGGIDPNTKSADVFELTSKESGFRGSASLVRKGGRGLDVLAQEAGWEGIVPEGTSTEEFADILKADVQGGAKGQPITESFIKKAEAEWIKDKQLQGEETRNSLTSVFDREIMELQNGISKEDPNFDLDAEERAAIQALEAEASGQDLPKELEEFFSERRAAGTAEEVKPELSATAKNQFNLPGLKQGLTFPSQGKESTPTLEGSPLMEAARKAEVEKVQPGLFPKGKEPATIESMTPKKGAGKIPTEKAPEKPVGGKRREKWNNDKNAGPVFRDYPESESQAEFWEERLDRDPSWQKIGEVEIKQPYIQRAKNKGIITGDKAELPEEEGILYHYSPIENLESIKHEGIRAGKENSPRGGDYGAIYAVTNGDSNILGNAIARDTALETSEFGVLRFKKEGKWYEDPEFVDDGKPYAFFSSKNIPPNDIEILTKKGWQPIEDVDVPSLPSLPPPKEVPKETPKVEGGNPFKDSVVQEPVYHGTKGTFSEFNVKKAGNATSASSAKKGLFFTSDPKVAEFFANIGFDPKYYDNVAIAKDNLSRLYKERDALETGKYLDRFRELRQSMQVKEARQKTDDEFGITNQILKIRDEIKKWRAEENRPLSGNEGVNIRKVYLNITNPLEVDFGGKERTFADISRVINKARKAGNDGVIIRNILDPELTDEFIVFSGSQVKSVLESLPNLTPPPSEGGVQSKSILPFNISESPKKSENIFPINIKAIPDSFRKIVHWQFVDGKWKASIPFELMEKYPNFVDWLKDIEKEGPPKTGKRK